MNEPERVKELSGNTSKKSSATMRTLPTLVQLQSLSFWIEYYKNIFYYHATYFMQMWSHDVSQNCDVHIASYIKIT